MGGWGDVNVLCTWVHGNSIMLDGVHSSSCKSFCPYSLLEQTLKNLYQNNYYNKNVNIYTKLTSKGTHT